MSKEDEYRSFAGDCLQMARSAGSSDHKLRLLHMATVWLNLADKVARWQRMPMPSIADHPLVKETLGPDRPEAA